MTTKITTSMEYKDANKLLTKTNALNLSLAEGKCSIDKWEREALMLFDQLEIVLWRLLVTLKQKS